MLLVVTLGRIISWFDDVPMDGRDVLGRLPNEENDICGSNDKPLVASMTPAAICLAARITFGVFSSIPISMPSMTFLPSRIITFEGDAS